MEKTIFVVDGRTRALKTFSASLTMAEKEDPFRVVLRHALNLGGLTTLLERGEVVSPVPILVMGAYQATNSGGHVSVFSGGGHRKVTVVGGLGHPFGRGGLRKLRHPIKGILLNGPVVIEEVAGWNVRHSNPATARAALEGAEWLAEVAGATFVIEGQSDYTRVVRLTSMAHDLCAMDFPVDHREALFREAAG